MEFLSSKRRKRGGKGAVASIQRTLYSTSPPFTKSVAGSLVGTGVIQVENTKMIMFGKAADEMVVMMMMMRTMNHEP